MSIRVRGCVIVAYIVGEYGSEQCADVVEVFLTLATLRNSTHIHSGDIPQGDYTKAICSFWHFGLRMVMRYEVNFHIVDNGH